MAILKAGYRAEAWIDDNAVPTGETFKFDISDVVRKMTVLERERLLTQALNGDTDLDYLVDRSGFQPDHNGPFTVKVDGDELYQFMQAEELRLPRYVVADGDSGTWTHLLDGKEVEIRFVYDREEERLVYCEIPGGYTNNGQYFVAASEEVSENIQDHLANANEEAIGLPLNWGLHASDELPDWVPQPSWPKP